MNLADLKRYIYANKHLPDMPTEKEVLEDNGIEIGQMQLLLLKKIEEQTLYILNLQTQIDALRKQLETLEKK